MTSNNMSRIKRGMKEFVHHYIGRTSPGYYGKTYGIELELEGETSPFANAILDRDISGWEVKNDGSLINGLEFVSKPIKSSNLNKSIGAINKYLSRCRLVNSVRTSTHVHLNVQDKTILEVLTLMACYYSVESLLTKWCGSDRDGNLFCLRQKDSKAIPILIRNCIKAWNINGFSNNNFRSTALNLNPVFSFGTLEFRSMRGITDTEELLEWIGFISSLYDNSSKFKNPAEVIMFMSGNGVDGLINALFSKDQTAELLKEFKDGGYEEAVLEDIRLTQYWATSVNWAAVEGYKGEETKQEIPSMKTKVSQRDIANWAVAEPGMPPIEEEGEF